MSTGGKGGKGGPTVGAGDRLRRAAIHGDYNQVMGLLSGGANPNSKDEDGLTALHLAVWNGHKKLVEALCANDIGPVYGGELKSCIHEKTFGGFTPLHLAAYDGINAAEIIPILLLCGANIFALDKLDRTPYRIALDENRSELAELLQGPPLEEEAITYYREQLEPKHRKDVAKYTDEFTLSKVDEEHPLLVPKRKREAPRPSELKLADYRIFPSFVSAFQGRGPERLRIMKYLLKQQVINVERKGLYDEYALTAENKWREEHPRVAPPQKELFLSNYVNKKPRIEPLVPVLESLQERKLNSYEVDDEKEIIEAQRDGKIPKKLSYPYSHMYSFGGEEIIQNKDGVHLPRLIDKVKRYDVECRRLLPPRMRNSLSDKG